MTEERPPMTAKWLHFISQGWLLDTVLENVSESQLFVVGFFFILLFVWFLSKTSLEMIMQNQKKSGKQSHHNQRTGVNYGFFFPSENEIGKLCGRQRRHSKIKKNIRLRFFWYLQFKAVIQFGSTSCLFCLDCNMFFCSELSFNPVKTSRTEIQFFFYLRSFLKIHSDENFFWCF